MFEDEVDDRYNPYPKIVEIATVLAELPGLLSHSSKKIRQSASRRLGELTQKMREEVSWLEDDENYEEWEYLSVGLADYERQLERGQYKESERTARDILSYSRG